MLKSNNNKNDDDDDDDYNYNKTIMFEFWTNIKQTTSTIVCYKCVMKSGMKGAMNGEEFVL